MTTVKSRIVKIGNSQGVRIPKLLLDQVDWGDEVELALQDDRIVIRPLYPARHDWDQAFKMMAEKGDDLLLDDKDALLPTAWDQEECEW